MRPHRRSVRRGMSNVACPRAHPVNGAAGAVRVDGIGSHKASDLPQAGAGTHRLRDVQQWLDRQRSDWP